MTSGALWRAAGITAAVGLGLAVLAVCLRSERPPGAGVAPDHRLEAGEPLTAPTVSAATWSAPALVAPRCVRVDRARERVFVCGTDGGLHVFDVTGRHLRSFPLPGERDGNPQGIAVDADGNVLIADTHAFQVLRISPEGTLLASYGQRGDGAGEFHWPTGVCEAPDRTLWVTEYGMTFDGDHDRLHHLTAGGVGIAVFGGTGDAPGKFYRPSNVVIGPDGNVWVADGCNHRIQVLAVDGSVLRVIDGAGTTDGPLRNPYDLWFDGSSLLVAEFGASRVRRFDADGRQATMVVHPGRTDGTVATPWGVTSGDGCLWVADTGNKRLQVWPVAALNGPLQVARGGESLPVDGQGLDR